MGEERDVFHWGGQWSRPPGREGPDPAVRDDKERPRWEGSRGVAFLTKNDTVAWNSVQRAFEDLEQSNLTRFAIDSHHLNNSLKDKLGSKYIIG